ncbi:MAG: Shedu immune nuclease family protein [Bacteroidota bacterium]|nr:Shedu immune nuclease family protein [Bacteroidota bacterium]
MEFLNRTTEQEVIRNSKTNHLYNHEFEGKHFFKVIFSDETGFKIQLAPKTMMQVVYKKEKNDIESIEIIKLTYENEVQKLKFSKFNFEQLRTFLEFINDTDLAKINERRTKITLSTELNQETKKQIEQLLAEEDNNETLIEILEKGIITSQDIVNTGYRKQQLEIFRKMLYDNYLQEYKNTIEKPNTKDEIAWQHFFNENQWIFGYGLDYRFQGILQKEFHASDTDAAGKESVNADFLLGDNNFTTFVELKLPKTELFGKAQNRSNSWRLSNKLIDAVSQILEQKASGQIKIEETKELWNDKGENINQHSYDAKTILIIGNWNEVENSQEPSKIKEIKRKTFELFRRDSRNVEILTYDELYNRAKFIVNQHSENKQETEIEDLPF